MRTTFSKTFTYYIVILLISSFLLSLGFTEIFRGYFYDDQKSDLLNQAIKISDIYTQGYSENQFNDEYFSNEIKILDKYMDYSFFITDVNLNVIAESKDILNLPVGTAINSFYGYKDVMEGNIEWIQGNISEIYSQNRYILCYPALHNDEVVAIVFVSVPLSELINNINRVYMIIVFFLILAAILGFVTIRWASKEFVMPLRELSTVARHISKGNFDERINIKENRNAEMTELCNSFNVMAESLASLEKRRREIISNISHDLRSPVTSIRGFLQAMLDGTISEDRYKHYMEIIYKETGRLNKLLNSILDLNKLDDSANAVNMKNFDINIVINETIRLMKVKADVKNIELKYNLEYEKIIVNADIDKIRRVMNNLVDNAIKFTEKGSIIIAAEIKNNKVFVSVEDTGVGLSEKEQNRVFERLYKADSSRGMDNTGSGLGLAIVKEFIKAHNQSIDVESIKGKGSKFTFTLDLA
ncbi:MAG: HAMP domain-containing sensor histidine kinase [Clostridia bacterium]|nr:HAMP domain-containing sensor histidine kinase [Clostridia bacterium]